MKNGLLFLALIALSATTSLLGCGEAVDTSQLSEREVILSWNAPTKNADGTTLTDLAGYRIYYSHTSGGIYPFMVTLVPTETLIRIYLPEDGWWYFIATAFDYVNNESQHSSEISAEISF